MPTEDLKYRELLKRNTQLGEELGSRHRFGLLGNLTVHTAREVLEYAYRSRGVTAEVDVGEYDNIAQESARFKDCDAVFVFYEAAGIQDNLPFTCEGLDEPGVDRIVAKAIAELGFMMQSLSTTRLVVFNLLSALPFASSSRADSPLERICARINAYVLENAPKCFRFVHLEKIFSRLSLGKAIDLRFYMSSRSLYTYAFFREYGEFVFPIVVSTLGSYKKVLVMDCDNSLWKGVLGEDGMDGIRMYPEIHHQLIQLSKTGVLVCLCSKNNPEDVDAVLASHPECLLKDEHIVLKAVSWGDKAASIRGMAESLNLGLDSFVFVDDSPFEIDQVKNSLPQVTTSLVPPNYADYVWQFTDLCGLFYREHVTAEDMARVGQYKTEFARTQERANFNSIADYLSSLGLTMELAINARSMVPRLAQLTQKTNQFNLTTVRMTEAEVEERMASDDSLVLGISVADKFGDYGLTGLLVLRLAGREARVENFLLSCRVLGREVERRLFDAVVELVRKKGIATLYGHYRSTAKNAQVADFYEKVGFIRQKSDNAGTQSFMLSLDGYPGSGIEYVGVSYA